eukprot:m.510153 g.510153  ORF g.510153 m.510153 type:complete len:53 (+) comp96099_c0_seq1:355-513(+)
MHCSVQATGQVNQACFRSLVLAGLLGECRPSNVVTDASALHVIQKHHDDSVA